MLKFEHKFNPKIGKAAKGVMKSTYNKMEKEKQSSKVGYYNLPQNSSEILKDIREYKKSNKYFKENLVRDIVIVGIGGSSLGTKAIYQLLANQVKTKKKLYFLENVDSIEIAKTLKKINKNKAVFIIVSKSGSTIETSSIFKYVVAKYKISFDIKDNTQRLIVVTDKDSPLSKFATKYNIKQFNIPSNVGGRFSVLSAVGLVPLALIDFDVKGILRGAKEYMDLFFSKKEKKLLEKAYFYSKNMKKLPINALFSYSSLFIYFNQWYVQLWAESLGKLDKMGRNVGLTPVHLIGSVDQHSFLQLIIQGPKNKTVTMLKVDNFKQKTKIPKTKLDYLDKVNYINGYKFDTLLNAQCDATYETLVDKQIASDIIVLDEISPYNVGALIIYYELLVSALGQMLDINAYNQPGVEFSKIKLVKMF